MNISALECIIEKKLPLDNDEMIVLVIRTQSSSHYAHNYQRPRKLLLTLEEHNECIIGHLQFIPFSESVYLLFTQTFLHLNENIKC